MDDLEQVGVLGRQHRDAGVVQGRVGRLESGEHGRGVDLLAAADSSKPACGFSVSIGVTEGPGVGSFSVLEGLLEGLPRGWRVCPSVRDDIR